jgi:hypothetical protein
MKSIILVTATRSTEKEFWDTSILSPNLQLHEKIGNIENFHIEYENSTGLGTLYNKFITEDFKDNLVLFCHDDITIDEINLKEKLNNASKEFDLIGVAGTAKATCKKPVTWSNSPRDSWGGAVVHQVKDKPGQYYTSHFGIMPKRCVAIDGLFMCINVERYLETGVRFDEQFNFHFYDMSFSIDSVDKKMKVGVWNIPVTHLSHGSYFNETWDTNEDRFLAKYNK